MLLVMEIFLLALAVMAFAPDTPLGKSLRAWMIEIPARATAKLTPAKIIVGAIVFVFLIGWAMSAPEVVAMIGFSDLAAYLDLAVVAMLLAAIARLKFVLGHTIRLSRTLSARFIARSTRSKARNRQSRRQRPKLPPSADENDPMEGLAFA
jgi:energy-converting hydrogenase Eha subunit C